MKMMVVIVVVTVDCPSYLVDSGSSQQVKIFNKNKPKINK